LPLRSKCQMPIINKTTKKMANAINIGSGLLSIK